MSFSDPSIDEFTIKGVVDSSHGNDPDPFYDDSFKFTFISEDNLLSRADYTIPSSEKWALILQKATFYSVEKCFVLPTAETAKTAKLPSYSFYEIEISIGQWRCYPIIDMKEFHPFQEKFNYVKSILEDMQNSSHSATPPPISEFCLNHYTKSLWEDWRIEDYQKKHYNLKAANEIQRYYGGEPVAPVLRTNFLKVIDRLHPPGPNQKYHRLTAEQFVYALNHLFSKTEIENATKNDAGESTSHFWGFQTIAEQNKSHPSLVSPSIKEANWGRKICWKSVEDALPIFDISTTYEYNNDKYVTMSVKCPLSLKYIAFGSILRKMCGFQKKKLTPPVKRSDFQRNELSIIYDSFQHGGLIAPGKIINKSVPDPVDNTKILDLTIPTPHFGKFQPTPGPPGTKQYMTDYYLWYFPKTEPINGNNYDYLSLLTTEFGNSKYDYVTIEAENSVNFINADTIFIYSENLVENEHIGNYESPILCTIPAPVYGFGYKNLKTESGSTTFVVNDNQLALEYEPDDVLQAKIKENTLVNFYVKVQNSFGDLLFPGKMVLDFLVRKISN